MATEGMEWDPTEPIILQPKEYEELLAAKRRAASLEGQVEGLKQSQEYLNGALDNKEEIEKSLKEQLKQAREAYQDHQASESDHDAWMSQNERVKQLEDELEVAKDENETLANNLEEAQAEVKNKDEEIKEKDGEINALRKVIQDKELGMEALQNKLSTMKLDSPQDQSPEELPSKKRRLETTQETEKDQDKKDVPAGICPRNWYGRKCVGKCALKHVNSSDGSGM